MATTRTPEQIRSELNVKALEVLDGTAALVRYRVKPNLRLLGPRLGRALPALRAALDALAPEAAETIARAAAGVAVHLAALAAVALARHRAVDLPVEAAVARMTRRTAPGDREPDRERDERGLERGQLRGRATTEHPTKVEFQESIASP